MADITLHPLEGVSPATRDAWVELVEILADWTPDAPLESGLPEKLLALLFAPLGTEAADNAARLRTAAYTAHHTAPNAHWYAADVRSVVEAVITALQSAPRLRLAGDSPTTDRGEAVTGSGGSGPVTAGGASDG